MKPSIVFGMLLVMGVACATPTRADGTAEKQQPAARPRPSSLYFRGRPLPQCRNFLITEIGVCNVFAGKDRGASGNLGSLDLGLMRNVSPRSAYGLSYYYGVYDESRSSGLRARYRYWLRGASGRARAFSLESGAGLLLAGSGKRPVIYPCPFVSGSINFKDWVTFTMQLEWIRTRGQPSEMRNSVGWHFGSYAGFIWIGAGLLVLVAASAAASSAGPWD